MRQLSSRPSNAWRSDGKLLCTLLMPYMWAIVGGMAGVTQVSRASAQHSSFPVGLSCHETPALISASKVWRTI
jgi:hypothetical protein